MGTPKAYPFLCNLLVGPARRDTNNGVDSGLRGFNNNRPKNNNRGVGGGNRVNNGGGSISTYGGPQQPTVTRNFVPKQQPRTQKPRTQRPKTKKPKRKKPKTQKPRKQKPRTQEVFSGLLPSYGRSPTSRQRIYFAG